MNAISLYVSASRLLFQSESDEPNYSDLYRLVPYLRQSLSCTVCANLLVEPFSPQEICQHHVCRTCVGGRKNLKPTCSSCRNYHTYQPNIQLRILLQCYKALCKYILGTPLIYTSMHKYVHVDGFTNGNNDTSNLAELIDEGARFHDDYKCSSGLPKSAFSILPCIFTTTSQSNHQSNTSTMSMANMNAKPTMTTAVQTSTPTISAISMVSTASVTATITNTTPKIVEPKDTVTVMTNTSMLPNPPIKTVSNGTALYSVMYAGSGNKITIKRKTDDSYFNNTKTLSAKEAKEMLDFLSGTTSSGGSGNQNSTSNSIQNQRPLQLHQTRPTIIHQSQSQTKNLMQAMPQLQQQSQIQNFKKPTMSKTKLMQKRKGCRCGNATPTPGKLTCCGQRCPCYVDSKSCVDCKCRGCRNPHRIDGLKVNLIFSLLSPEQIFFS